MKRNTYTIRPVLRIKIEFRFGIIEHAKGKRFARRINQVGGIVNDLYK